MTPSTARSLLYDMIGKPDWNWDITESDRYENAIVVRINYPTHNFNRDKAPYYADFPQITANSSYTFLLDEMPEPEDLYRAMLNAFLDIEAHEHREAFRNRQTGWSPFHPHKTDGMRRWGDIPNDLKFGIA